MIYYSITHYYYSILNINRQTNKQNRILAPCLWQEKAIRLNSSSLLRHIGSMVFSYIDTHVCFTALIVKL